MNKFAYIYDDLCIYVALPIWCDGSYGLFKILSLHNWNISSEPALISLDKGSILNSCYKGCLFTYNRDLYVSDKKYDHVAPIERIFTELNSKLEKFIGVINVDPIHDQIRRTVLDVVRDTLQQWSNYSISPERVNEISNFILDNLKVE